ncbi:MAG TPA: AgmX/PglI C-terminal domain-containing protein [Kofleriaceae bacterium]|nr:AgmX/PglI C-terminal domain-containing protein [Kofleriaceae bacterium]
MIRTTTTTAALFVVPVLVLAATAAGPAFAESEPPTDAFGLPCEVTFAPKSATPAKGAKAKKTKPAPAPAPVMTSGLGRGSEFALGRYDRGPSYKPDAESEMRMKAESLTPAMIGLVVRENATAVELCMTKLPKDSRVATVGLNLTIEPTGTVSTAKVTGAGKATAFSSCLAGAAKTWSFPHTDASVEIEYPITLNGR